MINELKKFCARYKKIYCYGAGCYGRRLMAYLDERGVSVKGFLVSEPGSERSVLGKTVEIFDEWKSDEETGIIIGVGKKNIDEVLSHVINKNISNYLVLSDEEWQIISKNTLFNKQYPLKHNICILVYHRVVNIEADVWKIAITPELFEEHLVYLKSHYRIGRFEDDWESYREPTVILTFDDGYWDIAKNALPLLEKYQIPGTVFVTTGNIDQKMELWYDELVTAIYSAETCKVLNWNGKKYDISNDKSKQQCCYELHPELLLMSFEKKRRALDEIWNQFGITRTFQEQCRTMTSEELKTINRSEYMTIGAHTISHPSLAALSHKQQRHEIQGSKMFLEKILEEKVTLFAYPFGQKSDYTEGTTDIALECGFKKIASAFPGLVMGSSVPINIPRNGIPAGTTVDMLQRKINLLFGEQG